MSVTEPVIRDIRHAEARVDLRLVVPESLHYFVRATRYGCVDKSIRRYSREAFDLLHRKYPKSEWTMKTPYWYG